MKNKLASAEAQVKATERKILEEIEERAIDISIERVRSQLPETIGSKDYEKHFEVSLQSVEKGLKRVF